MVDVLSGPSNIYEYQPACISLDGFYGDAISNLKIVASALLMLASAC
jgi:hypothetical protein